MPELLLFGAAVICLACLEFFKRDREKAGPVALILCLSWFVVMGVFS